MVFSPIGLSYRVLKARIVREFLPDQQLNILKNRKRYTSGKALIGGTYQRDLSNSVRSSYDQILSNA